MTRTVSTCSCFWRILKLETKACEPFCLDPPRHPTLQTASASLSSKVCNDIDIEESTGGVSPPSICNRDPTPITKSKSVQDIRIRFNTGAVIQQLNALDERTEARAAPASSKTSSSTILCPHTGDPIQCTVDRR